MQIPPSPDNLTSRINYGVPIRESLLWYISDNIILEVLCVDVGIGFEVISFDSAVKTPNDNTRTVSTLKFLRAVSENS